MLNRIYDYMTDNKMIAQGSRILAAVSGGADSMCLLAALRDLQSRAAFQLRVLHVHHGLRDSADRDLFHVSKYCRSAGIPFEAVHVSAGEYAAQKHLSVEEAARHLRYEALEEAARRWDSETETETAMRPAADKCRIAVAHHIEDQAETVLFNLARGSRLTGLRGMLPVNGRIIRPLLKCSRAEIETFLMDRGISWQEDETNEDTAYARNLLRREVMPLLERINARTAEHIARAAEEAAETEEFLKSETHRALAACTAEQTPSQSVISIPALLQETPLIGRRVIYEVIARAAGRKKDLQDVHVRDVLRLARRQGNGRLDVFGGVTVEKVYEKLLFSAGSRAADPVEAPGGYRVADPVEAPGGYRAEDPAQAPGGSRVADPVEAPGGSRAEDPAQAPGGSRAAESAAARGRRWPLQAAEYTCRVFDFDGDLSAVSRKQYTKWFDYDKIGAFPSFRNRRSGDRITLDESGRSKALRRYMIDAKIPADLRDRIVLPALGSEILWIPAGRADVSPAGASAEQAQAPAGNAAEQAEAQTVTDPPASKTEIRHAADSGRISAAYMVSSRTRRILEIRWQPARESVRGKAD